MRVAVVGCGYWGAKHVRVLHQEPGVEAVVGVDPDERRRAAITRAHPGVDCAPTLEQALDRVDAVVVATPPSTHAATAELALSAGRATLVEKPLATCVADARRLTSLAERRGATLMVGHTFLYNATVRALRELVDSGELGAIHYIDCARLNLGLYQRDCNVVWDLAPHDIAIADHLLGDRVPESVECWASRHAHRTLEDVAYLRLHYVDPDVLVHVHVSWLDPSKVRRVTVVGSRKMAVYNDLADEERLRIFDKYVVPLPSGATGQPPISYRYGGITSPFIQMHEPLVQEVRHFLECARTGQTPRTSGRDGLAVVQVLEALQRSLDEGREVPVAPDAALSATASA